MTSNQAGRIFRRWSNGRITDRLRPLSIDLTKHGFHIHKWTGELVSIQLTPPQNPDAPVFNGHRGELHEVVFKYARDELGIPIHLGYRIKQYFENDTEAGIVFENDEKATADIIIGSDGVRSKARELVLGTLITPLRFIHCVLHCTGYFDKPKSSGYAVFRAWCKSTVC